MSATFDNERVVCCKWKNDLMVITTPGLADLILNRQVKIKVVIFFLGHTFFSEHHTEMKSTHSRTD